MKSKATFDLEKIAWKKKHLVIGVDEVGRGALAGPLTVGAVCFRPPWIDSTWEKIVDAEINDSKVLTPKKREVLSAFIKQTCLAHATVSCSVEKIDSEGITTCLNKIFNDVVQLVIKVIPADYTVSVLIDGTLVPIIDGIKKELIQPIIDGDAKSISIAAASIVAKVDRDQQMKNLSNIYPLYYFEKNKGYGTRVHIEALRTHGSTPLHREKYIDGIVSTQT